MQNLVVHNIEVNLHCKSNVSYSEECHLQIKQTWRIMRIIDFHTFTLSRHPHLLQLVHHAMNCTLVLLTLLAKEKIHDFETLFK